MRQYHDRPQYSPQGLEVPRVLRRFEIYTMAEGVAAGKGTRTGGGLPALRGVHPRDDPLGGGKQPLRRSTSRWCGNTGTNRPRRTSATWCIRSTPTFLDRYLLNDCPERIVGHNPVGRRRSRGLHVRRPDVSDARRHAQGGPVRPGGPRGPTEVVHRGPARAGRVPKPACSCPSSNRTRSAWPGSMASRRMLPPSQWTHVWELGFESGRSL